MNNSSYRKDLQRIYKQSLKVFPLVLNYYKNGEGEIKQQQLWLFS